MKTRWEFASCSYRWESSMCSLVPSILLGYFLFPRVLNGYLTSSWLQPHEQPWVRTNQLGCSQVFRQVRIWWLMAHILALWTTGERRPQTQSQFGLHSNTIFLKKRHRFILIHRNDIKWEGYCLKVLCWRWFFLSLSDNENYIYNVSAMYPWASNPGMHGWGRKSYRLNTQTLREEGPCPCVGPQQWTQPGTAASIL